MKLRRYAFIDGCLVLTVFVGLLQCLYCSMVGTFPFNAFLAGLFSCVGMFVLTMSLRLQITCSIMSERRALAEFVFAGLFLHCAVYTFIGV